MFKDQTELFTKTHFLETSKFRPIDHESISKNPINIRALKKLEPYDSKNTYYNMLPNEKTNLGLSTKIPLKEIFRTFLYQILIKFN